VAKKKKLEPAKPKYPFKAVYTGRRVASDGKVYQRFEKIPGGNEMYFKGIKGVWLGHIYACGDGTISMRPERIRDEDPIDDPEWEAADTLVDAHNAKKRAEATVRKASKPALKAAIAALKPLCEKLDYFQRKTLITHLAMQLAPKGKWEKIS
jgi:hypothetical protein